MTPQELKNSILQLAIQGKLVEQRPEEGTAAELVEKMDFGRLSTDFVKEVPVSSLQRLGYILDEVLEQQEAADAVYDLLIRAGARLQAVTLKAGKDAGGAELNERWKIRVNETIEIDEL